MLSKTQKLLSDAKANISHIDCTLVGESPKIAKYTDHMCNKLAKTLKTKKFVLKAVINGQVKLSKSALAPPAIFSRKMNPNRQDKKKESNNAIFKLNVNFEFINQPNKI